MRRTRIGALYLALAWMAPGIASAQTEQIYYYHMDAIGSVRMITNESGQEVTPRYDYWPFGQVSGSPAVQDSRMFGGKEHDGESGLDYFGARYYQSATGRFTSPDPLITSAQPAKPQTWNRYTYALNNPLKYTDPTGLYVWGSCSGSNEECETERQRFRDSLETLKAAASQLPDESRKKLEKVIKKLGEEGEGRIKINFGDAGTSMGDPNLGVTLGNSVTINYAAVDALGSAWGLSASESTALDAGVTAHEATHAGGWPSVLALLRMRGEHAAYWNESLTYQGLQNTDRPFQLWNENWLAVGSQQLVDKTREQAIQHLLHPDKVPVPVVPQGGRQ